MCHYLRKTMVKLVCVRTTKKGRLRRMAFNNKQGIILVWKLCEQKKGAVIAVRLWQGSECNRRWWKVCYKMWWEIQCYDSPVAVLSSIFSQAASPILPTHHDPGSGAIFYTCFIMPCNSHTYCHTRFTQTHMHDPLHAHLHTHSVDCRSTKSQRQNKHVPTLTDISNPDLSGFLTLANQ